MRDPILVTGGCGFIGSAVVRHLIRETDRRVVNLDALTYAASPGAVDSVADSPRHVFEEADVRDADALERVFREHRPGAVIHLAAETHVDRSIDDPEVFLSTNTEGTFRLLEVARAHWRELPGEDRERFRFLHVSTDEVYGDAAELDPGAAFREDTPYDPSSPYAATKAAADHLVRAWSRTYGLPVLVTNCSNNFGPWQFPEKLIPHMALRAIEGEELPVYGDGRQVRDWLHVEDHARALLRVLEEGTPGETYCLGAREERENIEVVRAICRILDDIRPREDGVGYAEQITFVEDRPGHDRRYAMDPTRLEEELGWAPGASFEEALRATVLWYLENEAWWRPIRRERYGGERLGVAE